MYIITAGITTERIVIPCTITKLIEMWNYQDNRMILTNQKKVRTERKRNMD